MRTFDTVYSHLLSFILGALCTLWLHGFLHAEPTPLVCPETKMATSYKVPLGSAYIEVNTQ
jgi:hypothetical protein